MGPKSRKKLIAAVGKRRVWRRRRQRVRRYASLLGAALVAIVGLRWGLTSKAVLPVARGSLPAVNRVDETPARPAAIRKSAHIVYPHSVIPGGVYSGVELEAALRADPVAAAHYAVFDRFQVRLARSTDAEDAYVSYRKADRIYWTRRKVHLPAEEALLTDGVHLARARCGNRISFIPQEPLALNEPSPAELDSPEPDASPEPDNGATIDVYPPPRVVHEVFPGFFGGPQPDVTLAAGGVPNGYGWGSMPRGGMAVPSLPQDALPAIDLPVRPTVPGVSPIATVNLPPAPIGPGFLWFPPTPPAGNGPGGPGPSAWGTATPPPAGWGPPPTSFPPIAPGPVISVPTVPTVPLIPLVPPPYIPPGFPPLTLPGTPVEPTPTDPDPQPPKIPLPPDSPQPPDAEIPEPATAALLLLGAAILACRHVARHLPR